MHTLCLFSKVLKLLYKDSWIFWCANYSSSCWVVSRQADIFGKHTLALFTSCLLREGESWAGGGVLISNQGVNGKPTGTSR